MKNIWIYAEQNNGIIHPVYFELLGKARTLYPDGNLTAVVLGADNEKAVELLRDSGANAVISAEHEKLSAYHPDYYAVMLAELAKVYKPEIILTGATAIGSELAPSVAAKLQTGLAAHCADLCTDEKGELITIIPAFGGKLLGEILIPEKRPAMATVKPGVFGRCELSQPENVSVINADTYCLDAYKSRITLAGIQKEDNENDAIEDADVVVCAGLGIGSLENWKKAEKLAKLLKGKLGYTRPMVDMGYVEDESAMIGTSGKLIHPKLYIGFGVSGATHHVCGMKDSKMVISINSDEKAAIFNVSNYKLVGDSGIILDKLLQALKD